MVGYQMGLALSTLTADASRITILIWKVRRDISCRSEVVPLPTRVGNAIDDMFPRPHPKERTRPFKKWERIFLSF
jgi:hypothetical protein